MPGTTDRRPTVVVAGADRWSAQDLAERIECYFAGAYEVLSAATRGEAEQVLEGAASAGRRVAAVVAAADLSDGPGLGLLRETGAVPPAGRLLLSDSGTRAGGEGLDGIQVLPARPDEDDLWPRLERMLYDTAPQGERKVVVQGDRRSAAVYRVVRFLLLNHVTFTVEGVPEAEVEVAVEIDGRLLPNPPLITLAKALELTRYSGGRDFDVVVVGGGPAGLTAAINHAGLFGHKVLVIENEAPGVRPAPRSMSSTTTSVSPTASWQASWPSEGCSRPCARTCSGCPRPGRRHWRRWRTAPWVTDNRR